MSARAIAVLPRLFLLAAFLAAAAPALAAPAVSAPADMPLAGPPPEGDLLPPVPDQVRARAAVEMLLVVVGGLVLIAFLLRLVRHKEGPPSQPAALPETDAFERARRALEELDRKTE